MPSLTQEELDELVDFEIPRENTKNSASVEPVLVTDDAEYVAAEREQESSPPVSVPKYAVETVEEAELEESAAPVAPDHTANPRIEDQNPAITTKEESVQPANEVENDVMMHDAQEEIEQSSEDESDDDVEAETADEGPKSGEPDDSQDDSNSEGEEEASDGENKTVTTDIGSEDEQGNEDSDRNETKCAYCQDVVPADDLDKSAIHLTCADCGVRAHQTCALSADPHLEEDFPRGWQCQKCAEGKTSRSPEDSSNRKKNAAPRLVRDLLPVSRGLQKPNSHSIFAHPLISEAEDGGRSLRKRKSPTSEPAPSEKRARKATPKALSIAQADEESVAHATRRASQKLVPTARVLQHRPPHKAPPHKFILAFRLDQNKIEKILSKPSRPGKRRDRRRPPKIPPPPVFHAPVPKFPPLPTNHLIFPSMWGDRENEINAKPYGGILSDQEGDTSRSLPQLKDREIFEIARKEAEEERRMTSAAAEAEINGENANTTKPSRTVSGPPSKIKCIQFGKYVIDTFYAAPYPEEYSHESRLFICEFCLKYLPSEFVAYRHKLKCPAKHPPGDEIYRDGTISIWEVDGRKKTEYCQCLCLMAKMFLGSKTLYYDVEPFLFYILTEYDEFGYHFVGYFSKEKRPASQNNVSCILVMPIHQRKGYATFLIDFSYLLTRIEGKDGSPEKPLSDMGLTAYRSYWDLTLSKQLLQIGMKPFSTKDLMQRTGMTADDVIHSLERLYAFVRDPITKVYAIRYDKQLYENIVHEYESKKHRDLRPENLVWTPYIMGRSDQAQLDSQPMQTVAPREGEEVVTKVSEDGPSKSKAEISSEDAISPKTVRAHSRELPVASETTKDPRLVNGDGHIAPGPPPTQALTSVVLIDPALSETQTNGVTNGHVDAGDDDLTGYALAYRNHKIPPSRFQIDPPIPSSMLRARLNRRKSTGRPRLNGTTQESPAPAPVRSSPRHAPSVNGSVGDPTSPEKPSTPIRRSNRKSGLANMEVAVTDGSADENDQDDQDDPDDESEAKPQLDDDDDEEEEEEEAEASSTDEDDDEEEVEESTSDADVDVDVDADEEEEEEEEPDEAEDGDEDEDDDDPEVEIEEDEESEDPDEDE